MIWPKPFDLNVAKQITGKHCLVPWAMDRISDQFLSLSTLIAYRNTLRDMRLDCGVPVCFSTHSKHERWNMRCSWPFSCLWTSSGWLSSFKFMGPWLERTGMTLVLSRYVKTCLAYFDSERIQIRITLHCQAARHCKVWQGVGWSAVSLRFAFERIWERAVWSIATWMAGKHAAWSM